MTHQALTFTLTSRSGRLLGMALVCVEARYASVFWGGADRLDRLYVSPADWKAIEQHLSLGLSPSPIPHTTSALWKVLTSNSDRPTIAQWLSVEPVTVERPELTADVLDAKLRGIAGRSPDHMEGGKE
jgi:hypothetical protein